MLKIFYMTSCWPINLFRICAKFKRRILTDMLSELFEEILDSEKSFKEKVDRLRARGWGAN